MLNIIKLGLKNSNRGKTIKQYIHVNQHIIKANKKSGKRDNVLSVKSYKSNTYTNEIEIKGPCKIVYTPDKPLSCGATVYIIVEDGIEVICKK